MGQRRPSFRIGKIIKRNLSAGVLLFLAASPLTALDSLLIEEFWYDLETIVPGEPIRPVPAEEGARRLLEEARYIFSGMLYGFHFEYEPGDSRFEIEDQFSMTPIAEIPFGDPALSIVQTRMEKKRLIVRIRYDMVPFQQARLEGWDSNMFPSASGLGEASFYKGQGQRIKAVEEGVRQALRNHLRARVYDRPQRVSGDLVFEKAPRILLDEGLFKAVVQVRLNIREIKKDEYR